MTAIYRIWNTRNGKSYIGQSNRPYHRILRHLMPNSSGGSPAIHADLLNYPSDAWQWEIIADTSGRQASNFWHFSLTDLECHFIREFDSVRNGYNISPGSVVKFSLTHDEPYLSWGIKTFHRSEMQQVIYDAIDDYQFQHQHGISRAGYQRQCERQRDANYLQRFGVTYDEYEQIIARHGSWEVYQTRKAERTGCLIVFIILLLPVVFGLASGC